MHLKPISMSVPIIKWDYRSWRTWCVAERGASRRRGVGRQGFPVKGFERPSVVGTFAILRVSYQSEVVVVRRRAAAFLAALVVGTGLAALVGVGPAAAGGWAVTVVDPLPSAIEAGTAYEVKFWVLQHGTHPYNWGEPSSIGEVGLTLADTQGTTVSFRGRALAEPAHYVTTLTVPRAGRWRVTGVQGVFANFHVGTLTVPGTLTALGVPAAPSPADLQKYWPGPVRPPVLQIDQNRDPFIQEPSDLDQPAGGPPAPASAAVAPAIAADSDGVEAAGSSARTLLLAAMIGAVVLLGWTVGRWRLRVRRTRRASTSPMIAAQASDSAVGSA
jgi:hypothetical protein